MIDTEGSQLTRLPPLYNLNSAAANSELPLLPVISHLTYLAVTLVTGNRVVVVVVGAAVVVVVVVGAAVVVVVVGAAVVVVVVAGPSIGSVISTNSPSEKAVKPLTYDINGASAVAPESS